MSIIIMIEQVCVPVLDVPQSWTREEQVINLTTVAYKLPQ